MDEICRIKNYIFSIKKVLVNSKGSKIIPLDMQIENAPEDCNLKELLFK